MKKLTLVFVLLFCIQMLFSQDKKKIIDDTYFTPETESAIKYSVSFPSIRTIQK